MSTTPNPVSMICKDLAVFPNFPLPAGYSLRWYQPEDEYQWLSIHKSADRYNNISMDLYWRTFGNSMNELGMRQCYLLNSSQHVIGTATAWYNDNYNGLPYGRIHWIAIIPEMQGLGLAKPLLSAVCERLVQLNHQRVYLTTIDTRINAINLYLKFGFTPELPTDTDRQIWEEIGKKLEKEICNCELSIDNG